MLTGLFIVSLVITCVQLIKEWNQPTIPAENWANEELYYKDVIDGVHIEQRMKNLEDGKYKLTKANTHPEPHRDANGKIIIENSLLYKKDLKEYGAVQTMKWVKQGKYNLTKDELKKEEERIKAKFEYMYKL